MRKVFIILILLYATNAISDAKNKNELDYMIYKNKVVAGDMEYVPILFKSFYDAREYLDDEASFVLNQLKISAKNGETESIHFLGQLFLEGLYVEKNESKGLELLIKSATKGWVASKIILGVHYLGLINSENDALDNAKYWFESAASTGNIDAMYQLGVTILAHESRSHKQAEYWLHKALINGHSEALSSLQIYYEMLNKYKM